VTAVFEPSPRDGQPLFMGFSLADCGEHRTVGAHRAWCYQDTEWCYPSSPCRGCELPSLRERITAVEVVLLNWEAGHYSRDELADAIRVAIGGAR